MTYSPTEFEHDRNRWVDAFHLQLRVIAALVRRETRVHFGESRLGYLWAVIEPLAHLAVLMFIFVYIFHRQAPIGGSIVVFFLSGLIPYFMYLRIASYLTGAVSGNRALLNLPPVKPIDVLIARGILEAATYFFVSVIIFGGLVIFGNRDAIPSDPLSVVEATVVCFMLGLGIGMINSVISLFVSNWGLLFGLLSTPVYFLSGIFFMVSEMPPVYRPYLLYNPFLHLVEWYRTGFYQNYDTGYLDRSYVLHFAVGVLVVGLGLIRICRRKILEPT
jgi:capsular polysaccharide transport system permease protein